jgi:F-type H+-transporting ATPase subunit alpha
MRPAINAGISVSRVGGNAQIKAMRQVAGTLRLDMAQYRELAAFAQFGSDQLDKTTQAQLFRGQRLMEVLKQDQYQPLPVEKQIVLIFAATNRYLDSVEVADCGRYERELYAFVETNYDGLLKMIREKKAIDDAVRAEMTKALDAFKERFQATAEAATAAVH